MSNVRQMPGKQPSTNPTNGNGGGGNGGVINHRLGDLERRMELLEGKIDALSTICTQISTKLNGMATEAFVWKTFAGAIGVAVFTLIAHVMLRSMT